MYTQVTNNKSPHLLIWIAGIAVILFSVAGIAAIMGWIPTSMSRAPDVALTANDATTSAAVKPALASSTHQAPVITQQAPVICHNCGVIESTRMVTTKGEGSGIGAVGGAVVGGLLGNQIGAGRGKTAATVVGAVGGVVAGNEIEKRVNSTQSYQITVRMNDGTSRTFSEASAPGWRNGDRVKIVNDTIRANP